MTEKEKLEVDNLNALIRIHEKFKAAEKEVLGRKFDQDKPHGTSTSSSHTRSS